MANGEPPHLTLAELQRLLREQEPGVLLVTPRLLRRVIKQHGKVPGLGLQVPHRKSYVISREALQQIATPQELGLIPEHELPAILLLVPCPASDKLQARTRDDNLLRFWRLLFHARVHASLEHGPPHCLLTAEALQERIARIGAAEFEEIRAVLHQENFLLPPGDDRTTYIEFAALYLELRYFADYLLPPYFPSFADRRSIDAILAENLEGERLLAGCRPVGAPDPMQLHDQAIRRSSPGLHPPCPLSEAQCQRLLTRADRAEARGNLVRAALCRERAASASGNGTRRTSRQALDQLVIRLQTALRLDDAAAAEWRQALEPLLPLACRGVWPVEARLLYDLQKVCLDHERQVYAVDLVEWALSFGRRPIKRLLPHQSAVLVAKHLRSAARRLPDVRLPSEERCRLDALLHHAGHQAEERLREHFRPLVAGTFRDVGLVPQNLPEHVALRKLTEEILDLVAERGHVTIGDLRDAISRNDLKLPDLQGPRQFWNGDELLRTDRRFARSLDGIYRHGEVYMRWLQRISSLAFGTRIGRFLTRNVALPYGGAFVLLEGLQHIVGHFVHELFDVRIHLASQLSIAVLGTFLLALFQLPKFRVVLIQGLRLSAHAVRGLCIDLPAYLLRLPLVRRVLDSQAFVLLRDFALKPLLVTSLPAVLFLLYGVRMRRAFLADGLIFVASAIFLNTSAGRDVEEAVVDALVRTWRRFHLEIFPELFRFVMEVFKGFVEEVERLLYTVDEWLRFRSGQNRLTLLAKTTLGTLWFFVTYIVRIYVNLLIEPTVNPIKHFPVVTVAAKLILPFAIPLIHFLAAPLMPLGPWVANIVALVNLTLIPGVFGFLVWESKENWRLYQANRPRTMQPVLIGHHGETMRRLLRPGFHSGTIPKLYSRLRRAERRAHGLDDGASSRKYREALQHVKERVCRFVDRELLCLLAESKCWGNLPVKTGAIRISVNSVRVELCCPGIGGCSLWLTFGLQGGWLVAEISRPGWLEQLSPSQQGALATALAGIYKKCNVDLIREQLCATLTPRGLRYALREEGSAVWREEAAECVSTYDPRTDKWLPSASAPILAITEVNRLFFRRVPILWRRWVEAWQADQLGKDHPHPFLEGVALLPDSAPLSL
jgi:hypothetical protein